MQGNHRRRLPAASALPFVEDAKRQLLRITEEEPRNAEAWALLSQAHEALLEYSKALAALKRAALLMTPDHRALKARARLEEASGFWKKLSLTPAQASELRAFLLSGAASASDLSGTLTWLRSAHHPRPDAVLEAMHEFGAMDDVQAAENVLS
jgi:tetratricopeptide (TPR) repeat protein